MTARLLESRRALHKDVAEIISEKIIAGEWPSNAFLPTEAELCKKMGVSRTVIREAIKVLENSGLVRIDRGFGTRVLEAHHDSVSRPLKMLLRRQASDLKHLIEVRKIIEVAVVGLAAERRSEENLTAMERALQVMRENSGDSEGYVDADLQFHAEIARATKNPTILVILEPLGELLRKSRIASFSGPRISRIRTQQHEAIFECIRRGDAQGAQAAMSEHLRDTERDLGSAPQT
jgi:GntR family transcriptional regulator, transcriptional repressor for pyruvate dehydrogenase complex